LICVKSAAVGATCDIHQLGDLAPLAGLVAGGDRILDAVGDMIAQNLLFGTPQRGAHHRDLGDDVDAIAVLNSDATSQQLVAAGGITLLLLLSGMFVPAFSVNMRLSARDVGGSIVPPGMITPFDTSAQAMRDMAAAAPS
jgi:hypothetical protein